MKKIQNSLTLEIFKLFAPHYIPTYIVYKRTGDQEPKNEVEKADSQSWHQFTSRTVMQAIKLNIEMFTTMFVFGYDVGSWENMATVGGVYAGTNAISSVYELGKWGLRKISTAWNSNNSRVPELDDIVNNPDKYFRN